MRPIASVALLSASWLLVGSYAVLAQAPADTHPATETPRHLSAALDLVEKLKGSSLNVYGGGKREIHWEASPATARTVCSSFATLLLQHAYGYSNKEVKDWFGLVNPKAKAYHDAILAGKGFKQILNVTNLLPGDYLAIKYTDHHVSANGVENTGHVMLIVEAPKPVAAIAPVVSGTSQYLLKIVDSTSTGHGQGDTRSLPDGKFSGGIGIGTFRIYADDGGKIAGYAWSASPKSQFYRGPERDLVAGRIQRKN